MFLSNSRIVLLYSTTVAIGIMAFKIAVVVICIYLIQQVPAEVNPQRNNPVPAATIPATTFPSSAIPQAIPKTQPKWTPKPTPEPVITVVEIPPKQTSLRIPNSGEVRMYRKMNCVGPLEIKTSVGNHYLVRLYKPSTGELIMSVFVQGGRTERIKAPLGTYVMKFASGKEWYGYANDRLFGPSTVCTKADELFSFTVEGNRYMGNTVTLYNVVNGNLSTSQIPRDQF
jgi:hypothetical protein